MPSLSNALQAALSYAQWVLLVYIAFCGWITWRIAARWKREALAKGKGNDRQGCGAWFSYFIVFTLLSFLSMAAVLMPVAIAERASVFVTGDAHLATVVSVSSREERVTREDSDGHSYNTTVIKHTPTYAFTLADGTVTSATGDVSSESEPTVGGRQKIFYDVKRGRMVTASISNVLMLCAGALFSFFFILAMYAVLRYAFGRSTAGVMRLMAQALMNGVLPLVMGLMAIGLGWYAYERFTTNWHDDDPVFVAGICAFFAVTLLFVMVRWVQGMLARKSG